MPTKGPERDLAEAQRAFGLRDLELSKSAHQVHGRKEPHGGKASEYLESIVFGGLDGIITTFAVVAAAAASNLSYGTILIIGFANLIGDAIGMAIGDYLSTVAEDDHEKSERKRETWEVDNVPELEKKEMIDIYRRKGMTEDDAKTVVDLLFESKEAFLDIMMIEELGMMPAEAGGSAWKGAIATFFAFILLGGLPMLPYLFSGQYNRQAERDAVFWIAIGLFGMALFVLGAFKGKITGNRWYLSGLAMLLNGSITTLIAYFVGWGLEQVGN